MFLVPSGLLSHLCLFCDVVPLGLRACLACTFQLHRPLLVPAPSAFRLFLHSQRCWPVLQPQGSHTLGLSAGRARELPCSVPEGSVPHHLCQGFCPLGCSKRSDSCQHLLRSGVSPEPQGLGGLGNSIATEQSGRSPDADHSPGSST